jgi:hypothetical protein
MFSLLPLLETGSGWHWLEPCLLKTVASSWGGRVHSMWEALGESLNTANEKRTEPHLQLTGLL